MNKIICGNCKYYSNNIKDDNLRKGYCCRFEVGDFCTMNFNDYCSKGEPIVECKTYTYNKKNNEKEAIIWKK